MGGGVNPRQITIGRSIWTCLWLVVFFQHSTELWNTPPKQIVIKYAAIFHPRIFFRTPPKRSCEEKLLIFLYFFPNVHPKLIYTSRVLVPTKKVRDVWFSRMSSSRWGDISLDKLGQSLDSDDWKDPNSLMAFYWEERGGGWGKDGKRMRMGMLVFLGVGKFYLVNFVFFFVLGGWGRGRPGLWCWDL